MSRCHWHRDQTPIQKQTKNRELSKPNTEHRGVYQKKKKIPNTQTKTKPSNPRMVTSLSSSLQRAHRCCYRLPSRPSSQIDIVDGRSVIGSSLCASASALVSGARCFLRQSGPPSRFFSLTLSQTLSLSLSLYLTE